MSISQFMRRKLNDNAVYWAPNGNDGYGTITYANPVEIDCFWVEDFKSILTKDKREIVSDAQVYVNQELAQHGILYHGTLDEILLSDSAVPEPRDVQETYEIQMTQRFPSLRKKNDFVYVNYL